MAEKNEGQADMQKLLDSQPTAEGEQAEQDARDEAAEAAAAEADRQKARADKLEEFNKAAYEESISGQELPPSVQEAQKTERKAVAASSTKTTKGG